MHIVRAKINIIHIARYLCGSWASGFFPCADHCSVQFFWLMEINDSDRGNLVFPDACSILAPFLRVTSVIYCAKSCNISNHEITEKSYITISWNVYIRWQWRDLLLLSMHGQCCRRHLVGQLVVSDIGVARSCWSIIFVACVTPAQCYTWNVYFASHTKNNLIYNMVMSTWWTFVQNLVTALHLSVPL